MNGRRKRNQEKNTFPYAFFAPSAKRGSVDQIWCDGMVMKTFEAGGKHATLYQSEGENSPLIVLNGFSEEGASIMEEMRGINTPDCSLLIVSNLNWDHDMSPWPCDPITKNDPPCTGGADDYLRLLLTRILPEAKSMLSGRPRFIGIAGYSLAGLFALYAMYRCDAFDRAASMSGSLWFPDFREFVLTHNFPKRPERIYLSLGDQEARTRNVCLRTVQDNTEKIVAHFEQLGLDVTWELNPGNHFRDAALRSAKGIKAILK